MTKDLKPSDLPIPQLDLTKIGRYTDQITTWITIDDYTYRGRGHVWIKCGAISLHPPSSSNGRKVWRFDARGPAGWTDPEHDSIKIASLDLVGVELSFVDNGRSYWTGWISPEADSFRVPAQDYVNRVITEASNCTLCKGKDKHKMLPEGFYLPKENSELFEMVRKYPIEIMTWANVPDGEE